MADGPQVSPEEAGVDVTSSQESPRQRMVIELASQFHEGWRQSYREGLQRDGKDVETPRTKPTKDAAWIKAHGTDQVDIAHTKYEDLPEDWQAENKAAAEVVMSGVSDAVEAGQNLNEPQTIEGIADTVHQAWLGRNGDWAPEEQKLPYAQLSEPEKAKDRDQVLKGVKVYSSPAPVAAPPTAVPSK